MDSRSYPKTEDAYLVLNMFYLDLFVLYFLYTLRSELRAAFLDNLVHNDYQKEVNWMMSRTLEISCI